jgi:hypothetical protein
LAIHFSFLEIGANGTTTWIGQLKKRYVGFAHGIFYLHKKMNLFGIVCGDIKASNIMLEKYLCAKIAKIGFKQFPKIIQILLAHKSKGPYILLLIFKKL